MMFITQEQPNSEDASALISELEAYLDPLYPEESQHGFSIEKLLQEKVDFFVARVDSKPASCGAIKLFGADYGEVKRLYVRSQFRGLGLGKLMLNHLANFAKDKGVHILRLETGIYQTEAISLYERTGYTKIGPFGEYKDDPLSIFYEKNLF
ncbi:MAG: GNAT family N-acetyltransferase [Leptolyngbyaceae cyanobacterium MO_188.B28]|nr:GNAT family N-acetyltransferase [Leptolyngbyaceae cyanobacterium MO_188.B28]